MKSISLLALLLFISASSLPSVGTEESMGRVDGIEINVAVQGPATQETPLQVACLFEYTEGDIYKSPPALPKELNGMVHLDEALNGLITEIRKTNKFRGELLETLLITPPPNTVKAKRLLLIGLGNRDSFKPEIMRMVGVVGMREALRMGVSSYAHASDLKDAGISSPTAEVAEFAIKGAIEAYRTQLFLKERNASENLTVNKMTLLAGPALESIVGSLKSLAVLAKMAVLCIMDRRSWLWTPKYMAG